MNGQTGNLSNLQGLMEATLTAKDLVKKELSKALGITGLEMSNPSSSGGGSQSTDNDESNDNEDSEQEFWEDYVDEQSNNVNNNFAHEIASAYDSDFRAAFNILYERGINIARPEILLSSEYIPLVSGLGSIAEDESSITNNLFFSDNRSIQVTNIFKLLELHRSISNANQRIINNVIDNLLVNRGFNIKLSAMYNKLHELYDDSLLFQAGNLVTIDVAVQTYINFIHWLLPWTGEPPQENNDNNEMGFSEYATSETSNETFTNDWSILGNSALKSDNAYKLIFIMFFYEKIAEGLVDFLISMSSLKELFKNEIDFRYNGVNITVDGVSLAYSSGDSSGSDQELVSRLYKLIAGSTQYGALEYDGQTNPSSDSAPDRLIWQQGTACYYSVSELEGLRNVADFVPVYGYYNSFSNFVQIPFIGNEERSRIALHAMTVEFDVSNTQLMFQILKNLESTCSFDCGIASAPQLRGRALKIDSSNIVPDSTSFKELLEVVTKIDFDCAYSGRGNPYASIGGHVGGACMGRDSGIARDTLLTDDSFVEQWYPDAQKRPSKAILTNYNLMKIFSGDISQSSNLNSMNMFATELLESRGHFSWDSHDAEQLDYSEYANTATLFVASMFDYASSINCYNLSKYSGFKAIENPTGGETYSAKKYFLQLLGNLSSDVARNYENYIPNTNFGVFYQKLLKEEQAQAEAGGSFKYLASETIDSDLLKETNTLTGPVMFEMLASDIDNESIDSLDAYANEMITLVQNIAIDMTNIYGLDGGEGLYTPEVGPKYCKITNQNNLSPTTLIEGCFQALADDLEQIIEKYNGGSTTHMRARLYPLAFTCISGMPASSDAGELRWSYIQALAMQEYIREEEMRGGFNWDNSIDGRTEDGLLYKNYPFYNEGIHDYDRRSGATWVKVFPIAMLNDSVRYFVDHIEELGRPKRGMIQDYLNQGHSRENPSGVYNNETNIWRSMFGSVTSNMEDGSSFGTEAEILSRGNNASQSYYNGFVSAKGYSHLYPYGPNYYYTSFTNNVYTYDLETGGNDVTGPLDTIQSLGSIYSARAITPGKNSTGLELMSGIMPNIFEAASLWSGIFGQWLKDSTQASIMSPVRVIPRKIQEIGNQYGGASYKNYIENLSYRKPIGRYNRHYQPWAMLNNDILLQFSDHPTDQSLAGQMPLDLFQIIGEDRGKAARGILGMNNFQRNLISIQLFSMILGGSIGFNTIVSEVTSDGTGSSKEMVDRSFMLNFSTEEITGVIAALRQQNPLEMSSLTGDSWSDPRQSQAAIEAHSRAKALIDVIRLYYVTHRQNIFDKFVPLIAHFKAIKRMTSYVKSFFNTNNDIGKSNLSRFAFNSYKELFEQNTHNLSFDKAFKATVSLNSIQSANNLYKAHKNFLSPSESFKFFTPSDNVTDIQMKLMTIALGEKGFGLTSSENLGKKSVLSVGIPSNFIDSSRMDGYRKTLDVRYLNSSKVCIYIFKYQDTPNSVLFYPKGFMFDANKFTIENSSSVIPKQIENFNDQFDYEALKDNFTLYQYENGQLSEHVGSAFNNNDFYYLSNGDQAALKNECLNNHILDHYLKMYYKLATNIDTNEHVFQVYKETKYANLVDTGIPSEVFNTKFIGDLLIKYPAANVDPDLSKHFNRLLKTATLSSYFSGFKRLRSTLSPKSFDRVFNIFINEEDFVAYPLTPIEALSDFYSESPTFTLDSSVQLTGSPKSDIDTIIYDNSLGKTYSDHFKILLGDKSVTASNYFCVATLVRS